MIWVAVWLLIGICMNQIVLSWDDEYYRQVLSSQPYDDLDEQGKKVVRVTVHLCMIFGGPLSCCTVCGS